MAKIVCVGAYVTDMIGRSDKLPERGQSVIARSYTTSAGGKGANQCVAAGRVGGDTAMVTKVGTDAFGEVAIQNFKNEGIDTQFIFVDEELVTGVALIFVNENTGENLLMIYPGACNNVTESDITSAESLIAGAEIVVIQLEIPHERNVQVVEIASAAGARVILNPAPARPVPDDFYQKIDIVTPNETETQGMVGVYPKDLATCREAAAAFFAKGVKQVVLTLGENGYYANDGQTDVMVPAYKVTAVDTTGAGDCFNGVFAARLADGDDFFAAAKFASAASALSVTKPGAAPSMPYAPDVLKLMAEQPL